LMSTFSSETLEQASERLAVYITRGQYVGGAIDHDQFEARIASIIGLNGARERARVLETTEVVALSRRSGHQGHAA
jgi:hypothetical protein